MMLSLPWIFQSETAIASYKEVVSSRDHLEHISGKIFHPHLIFRLEIFNDKILNSRVLMVSKILLILHD